MLFNEIDNCIEVYNGYNNYSVIELICSVLGPRSLVGLINSQAR